VLLMGRAIDDIRADFLLAIDRTLTPLYDAVVDPSDIPPSIERMAVLSVASDLYQAARAIEIEPEHEGPVMPLKPPCQA
jgi:hypothetical protein